MKIGIIGVGIVGGATKEVFQRAHEIFPYDKYKPPHNSEENLISLAENSEVVFLCVPTPMKPSGEMDYSAIYNSADSLETATRNVRRTLGDILLVVRSTAVSGATDDLAEKYPFRIACNPEFLREKHSLQDMENTDRVIIGANTDEDYHKILQVYKPLFPTARYVHVNRKTAEMIKYCANVMLAGQVALANELYQICNAVGVDYDAVKEEILFDSRIGRNIDVPGPDRDFGFGGKCFPKDLNALIYLAREKMYRPYLLEEVWRLNERVRTNKDWLEIPGATSGNDKFEENMR